MRPAPYSLQRNKSDGQLLRSQRTSDQTGILQYQQDLPSTEDADEQGYVSDVCDYNLETHHKEPNVVHGKLSLTIAPEGKTSPKSRVLQVRGGSLCRFELDKIRLRLTTLMCGKARISRQW